MLQQCQRFVGGKIHYGWQHDCIVGKRNQAVLLSMEDWNAIQESLYLNGFPGLADSIVEGMKTPVSECSTELKW